MPPSGEGCCGGGGEDAGRGGRGPAAQRPRSDDTSGRNDESAPARTAGAAADGTRTYRIRGLDCAEEVSALRDTVGPLPGVTDLSFNLIDGTMRVAADPGLSDEAILDAVTRAGLAGRRVDGATDNDETEAPEGLLARHGRTIHCAASGLFVVAGVAYHAAQHGGLLHALVETEGARHDLPGVSILFFAFAIATGIRFVLPKALAAARRLRPDMNLLMTVAVVGAVAIGEWLEGAVVTFLFAFSLLLESWSVERARRSIRALLDLTPPVARFRCPKDGDVMERPIEEVPVGAVCLVRPGERIPLDGVVVKGRTHVDQSPITGESLPVEKGPGDEVFAGTINGTGAFEFRTTRPAEDTSIARIIRMVEEAQSRRAPAERWVDSFARYYTPTMMGLSLLVALIPPFALGWAWSESIYQALVLLVIACPCALVISTPVSIVAALAGAARAGVLVKGGVHLESAARIRFVALDKTGTITVGRPEVQRVVPCGSEDEATLLSIAAAIEAQSEHPLARAIVEYAARRGIAPEPAEGFVAVKGKGAEAVVAGRRYWVGSHRFAHEKGIEASSAHAEAEAMERAGHSVVAVGDESRILGLIAVSDTIRSNAREAVAAMRAEGIRRVVILTGDNAGTARAVAEAVGVDEVRAELLPAEKVRAVEALEREGPTLMVGDGINDAPALAAATLGAAMGTGGTDVAMETADVALVGDDLAKIPLLFHHARRTFRIVWVNVAFSLGVKAVFLALASIKMATLWMAIAADMGASLVVIANGLRLLKVKGGRR